MQIIDSLKQKSSTGVDNISNKQLKSAKAFIVALLTIIINKMFQVGKFPDLLKTLKVFSIYKKNDDSLFSNYSIAQRRCPLTRRSELGRAPIVNI